MAEINPTPNGKRARKRSPRIDMTAMVDVAFLLLTFFILTTTLAESRALPLTMPRPQDGTTDVPCGKTLQVFLGNAHEVHYDLGCTGHFQTTDLSADGFRSLLTAKLSAEPELIISIKAMKSSTWRDVVDALDEMKIVGATRHTFASADSAEVEMLAAQGLR